MKKQIRFIFSCLLFVFYSCSQDKKTNETKVEKDTIIQVPEAPELTEEDRIISEVMSLPEVITSDLYLDSISDHKKGIAAIYDGPQEGSSDVGVRVGYNGDERFEVYYFFYVDPKTMQIKILDVVSDSIMLYSDWHRMKSVEN